jgi:hypothetical protein
MMDQDSTSMAQERMEKARLRGKHALEKEVLTQVGPFFLCKI